ncbi:hypothetical protein DYH09_06020 [bacterium CPR1]|nr:hypothetical protein [bacterium CPR1]
MHLPLTSEERERRLQVPLEVRWQVATKWQDESFELYLAAQQAQGLSREAALAQLAGVWEREEAERLEAHLRMARAG